ncbi:hypothetical protein ACWF62_00980 [Rhodococcus sp. NPDC054953]
MTAVPPPTNKVLARKIVGTCVFLAGLVGAAIGIWTLDVVVAVLWLVVASLAGFYLLKLRAEARGRLDRTSP